MSFLKPGLKREEKIVVVVLLIALAAWCIGCSAAQLAQLKSGAKSVANVTKPIADATGSTPLGIVFGLITAVATAIGGTAHGRRVGRKQERKRFAPGLKELVEDIGTFKENDVPFSPETKKLLTEFGHKGAALTDRERYFSVGLDLGKGDDHTAIWYAPPAETPKARSGGA